MNEQLVIETILNTGGKIDTLWNMFIYLNIGIAGFIVIHRDNKIHLIEFVVGCVSYSYFIYINYNALYNTYVLLDSFHEQFRVFYYVKENYTESLRENFVKITYAGRPDMIMVTHLLAATIVFMSLFFKSDVWTHLQRIIKKRRA